MSKVMEIIVSFQNVMLLVAGASLVFLLFSYFALPYFIWNSALCRWFGMFSNMTVRMRVGFALLFTKFFILISLLFCNTSLNVTVYFCVIIPTVIFEILYFRPLQGVLHILYVGGIFACLYFVRVCHNYLYHVHFQWSVWMIHILIIIFVSLVNFFVSVWDMRRVMMRDKNKWRNHDEKME